MPGYEGSRKEVRARPPSGLREARRSAQLTPAVMTTRGGGRGRGDTGGGGGDVPGNAALPIVGELAAAHNEMVASQAQLAGEGGASSGGGGAAVDMDADDARLDARPAMHRVCLRTIKARKPGEPARTATRVRKDAHSLPAEYLEKFPLVPHAPGEDPHSWRAFIEETAEEAAAASSRMHIAVGVAAAELLTLAGWVKGATADVSSFSLAPPGALHFNVSKFHGRADSSDTSVERARGFCTRSYNAWNRFQALPSISACAATPWPPVVLNAGITKAFTPSPCAGVAEALKLNVEGTGGLKETLTGLQEDTSGLKPVLQQRLVARIQADAGWPPAVEEGVNHQSHLNALLAKDAPSWGPTFWVKDDVSRAVKFGIADTATAKNKISGKQILEEEIGILRMKGLSCKGCLIHRRHSVGPRS